MTFPILRDQENSYDVFRGAALERTISPFPVDVVIDREGRLVAAHVEYDPGALAEAIEPLLDPE